MKKLKFKQELSREGLERLSNPWNYPMGRAILKAVNVICAGIYFLTYPLGLAFLLIRQDSRLFEALMVPACSFLVLSLLRKWINRPRPYEAFHFRPLVKKESTGASFPSRHVFSAFMIASTMTMINPWGCLLYIPAALLAVIRVISGIHYPSDVIAGAVFALICSFIYLI